MEETFEMSQKQDPHETGISVLTLLPAEMWLKIFQHCVSTDGPLPFLLRASKVCRTWRDLAINPVLWKKIYLNCRVIERSLDIFELFDPDQLAGREEIMFAADHAVKLIATHCPQLQLIDFTGNTMLILDSLTELFEKCQKLKHVNLSRSSPYAVSSFLASLSTGVLGSSLESINLKDNHIRDLNMNFDMIVSSCPRLKVLRLGRFSSFKQVLSIDPLKLQTSCPLLRVLDFKDIRIYGAQSSQEAQAHGNGLVHLQELRCVILYEYFPPFFENGMLTSLLPRLLHNSPQLKVLDVSGHISFDASVLLSLPIKALKELNLSGTRVTGPVLQDIFRRWGHSLTHLALSDVLQTWLGRDEVEAAFKVLTDLPTCPLRKLSLLDVRMSRSCVRLLAGKLEHLEVLVIQSLRRKFRVCYKFLSQHSLKRLHPHLCEREGTDPGS